MTEYLISILVKANCCMNDLIPYCNLENSIRIGANYNGKNFTTDKKEIKIDENTVSSSILYSTIDSIIKPIEKRYSSNIEIMLDNGKKISKIHRFEKKNSPGSNHESMKRITGKTEYFFNEEIGTYPKLTILVTKEEFKKNSKNIIESAIKQYYELYLKQFNTAVLN